MRHFNDRIFASIRPSPTTASRAVVVPTPSWTLSNVQALVGLAGDLGDEVEVLVEM
jgi:hypothetical protein